MSNHWKVTSRRFANDSETVMRNGNIYQIANGYMGYRGTLDEFGPGELVGITLAGIFDRVGDKWREPVNAPNPGFTQLFLDGQPISALSTPIASHRQTLHLKNAIFERETCFSAGGNTLRVRSSRFLSADQPNLGIIRYEFCCDKSAAISIHTGIDCNIWDLNGPHLPELTKGKQGEVLVVAGTTSEARKTVAVAESAHIPFGREAHEIKDNRNLRVIELSVEAGKSYTFDKYFAIFTANDAVPSPSKAAIKAVMAAKRLGYDACLQAHNACWQQKWSLCDVQIEGDPGAQRALRYSIFQLLIVAPVANSRNSIPARALSGQVYKGAIFWDTEMFMFPFFMHTCPDTAAELLRYRIKTLDGARRKALSEGPGYRGAFYAWESQDTGDDACTYFNVGDPITHRDLRTYFRDKQIHISGDVAIALWEYFRITGDDSILLEGGAEVIFECARFYSSFIYFKPDRNRYEVLDVTGPDEYHERVNNNAFTNMVVKSTFEVAQATVRHLERKHPAALRALLKKLAIQGELAKFDEVAKLLYVPAPDPQSMVIEQFDGYFKLRDTSIAELKAGMLHPNEYLGAAQGLAVPTKIIKQADVVLMLNVFKDKFSPEVMRANWEYYEPRTEHGSSLSACAYAMGAAEFGNLDFAYKYFLQTAKIDLEAKYKVYVGTVFMGGSHPAANGGAWMTTVFGFAGLHTTEKNVVINPRLYRKWKSLRFHLAYRCGTYSIAITPESVEILSSPQNKKKCTFVVAGDSFVCAPGQRIAVRYSAKRKLLSTRAPRPKASKAAAAGGVN